jgi:serine/threonine protein kinase
VPVHPNIVTLHRTLETSAFLLLVLEYVPGQDLFYFLEQARDHYDVDLAADPALTHTPPTPGLLSSLHPSQLLSHTRLRLIASMFAQMCEAVATCHDASVFHRDIKPENFIVTDDSVLNRDGIRERKVIVKLSDFGLSTRDAVSSDMDCGSAPYMSYGKISSHYPYHALSLRSPSQNAGTTWLPCISPVLRMYGRWASF